jgi:hypothetical protein
MTATAVAAGSTPAQKGLAARFIGIIVSPKDTFQAVAASPKVLGMLLTVSILTAVFAALPMTTDAGKQAAIDQQVQTMKSLGVQVNDELYDRMEKGASRLPYTTGLGAFVFIPVVSLIFAGILFAIFNAALGGEASYKQVFSVYIHSGVIGVVSAAASGLVNYFSGHAGSVANLGGLLPMLAEKSFLANLLGTIDIFIIWSFIVLAIGLGALYKRRTQPIAIAFFSIYGVIAVVIAIVKSSRGA